MIEVKFTCASAQEFKQLLALLASGNEEAASAYEDSPKPEQKKPEKPNIKVTKPKQPTVEEIAEVEQAQDEPAQEEPEETAPEVTLQDLQTLGRKLAAAGKGASIQAILKKHGVKLMSKIPESERAAAYAEMQEVEG